MSPETPQSQELLPDDAALKAFSAWWSSHKEFLASSHNAAMAAYIEAWNTRHTPTPPLPDLQKGGDAHDKMPMVGPPTNSGVESRPEQQRIANVLLGNVESEILYGPVDTGEQQLPSRGELISLLEKWKLLVKELLLKQMTGEACYVLDCANGLRNLLNLDLSAIQDLPEWQIKEKSLPADLAKAIEEVKSYFDRPGHNWQAWFKKACDTVIISAKQVQEFQESAHYANGVADLAMKHRNTAEKQVQELQEQKDNATNAYQSVKNWAHRLEAKLVAIMDMCEEAAKEEPAGSFPDNVIAMLNEFDMKQLEQSSRDDKALIYAAEDLVRASHCMMKYRNTLTENEWKNLENAFNRFNAKQQALQLAHSKGYGNKT